MAEKGTLFLDEIGDMPLALQVKMLRFLQEKTYEPLGTSKTRNADIRILAATNQSLQRLVKEARFREDLYYRINVIRIEIPPLRKRTEDIPLLVDHFLGRLTARQNKRVTGMSAQAMKILLATATPATSGNWKTSSNTRSSCAPAEQSRRSTCPPTSCPTTSCPPTICTRCAGIETRAIQRALERNNWNRVAARRGTGNP